MSSPYSVLNNRPVDQWKVTELREELRRRRLKTNGLKEELVKRLDGALRLEMEEAEKEELGNESIPDNDLVHEVDKEELEKPALAESIAEPIEDKVDKEKAAPPPAESNAELVEDKAEPMEGNAERVEDKAEPMEDKAEPVEGKVEEERLAGPEFSAKPITDKNDQAVNDSAMTENIDRTGDVGEDIKEHDQKEVGHSTLDAVLEHTTDNTLPKENVRTDSQTGVGQLESIDQDVKNKDSKPAAEDVKLTVSEPTNQVSEVSPDLGFQVRSKSISTDSVSINEKNELKDNLNTNNVNLELEVVKPEMVQPSSSDVPNISGDSHPLEDDKVMVDNQASLEEAGDLTCATDMELCKKMEGVDGESPEKLNLDRSSGDESMEEDVLESKQIESKNNSEEGEKKEDIKEDMSQVAQAIDAVAGGFSHEEKFRVSEEEIKPTAGTEKRKAEAQEAVSTNNEPKRQRRWTSDTAKAPELQTSYVTTSTPKDVFQPALRKSFSRSDSSLSADMPKERIVPPSQKPATTSLRIDHFLRPFTLKAVQELLAKTGTVVDFWMDQIKTHCYVTYSSVDEATATRNALYNLQWPTNGGRLLVAEFVEPQEVKTRLEAPPQTPAPMKPSPTTPTAAPFQRQAQAPVPSRPNNLTLSNPPPARERLPPPPPLPKKPEPPIMTLDDLFKKTKATPRIYYLPLSEEQVAAKLQAEQGK
ncbi:uncharacterized protein A4U43_C03F1450 [Asparagus officinalis]|uniref:SAP domain-containing protein n=1 Tax=Asparagus officinalis TaxID=4686 RepID=A0A5P1FAY5_ASPOF|nr:uncharacterized protein A4U43_C03F1450 [Asparagus officinalis]